MSSTTTDLQLPEGMTTLQILKGARDLISVPERWTQGATARNRIDDVVESHDVSAVCWCSYGALMRVSGGNHQARWIAEACLEDVTTNYISFNDSHTHAEVLAAFDRAIDAAGGSNGE